MSAQTGRKTAQQARQATQATKAGQTGGKRAKAAQTGAQTVSAKRSAAPVKCAECDGVVTKGVRECPHCLSRLVWDGKSNREVIHLETIQTVRESVERSVGGIKPIVTIIPYHREMVVTLPLCHRCLTIIDCYPTIIEVPSTQTVLLTKTRLVDGRPMTYTVPVKIDSKTRVKVHPKCVGIDKIIPLDIPIDDPKLHDRLDGVPGDDSPLDRPKRFGKWRKTSYKQKGRHHGKWFR